VTIEGIVVGDFETTAKLNGFFVQEENSDVDADPLTSEGIFVYNPGNNSVSVGQKVQVSGLVSEFHGLTEITASSIAASAGEAVSPAVISFPLASLTQLEQYEGMAIRIDQPMTVSETFLHGRYNQLLLAQGGRLFTPTNVALPGIAAANVLAANALRSIILDDDRTTQNPDPVVYPENGGLSANNTARVGEIVDGAILGILDCFDAYLIRPTGNLTFLSPIGNPRPTSPSAAGGTLRVASMNVLNYFTTFIGGRGAENQVEFDRQAPKIVDAILAMNPHVLGIMEVENNGNTAIADLVTKLNVPVPGKFQYINTGTVGTDQIKVGLIYQPSVVSPVGLPLILNNTVDPRAVDTLNRPVVAQTFERIGTRQDLQRFTVIVNHFKSKGSGCETQSYPVGVGGTFDTDQNDGQGNCNLTRLNIAAALNDWMASSAFAPTPVAERRFLVIGDLNAYAFEDPMSALTSTSFTKAPVIPAGNPNATSIDLTNLYIPAGSYSYVFDGQSGNLDHALASPAMEKLVTGFSEFHINADEPVAIDYNLNFKSAGQQISFFAPNMYRSSDHDPVVVNFNPLCGDLNDDGSVSVADQNLLRARYGQSAAGANRRYDYDRNGTINSNDYRLWLTCQRQFVN
jgi:predicted extracellular nuclease